MKTDTEYKATEWEDGRIEVNGEYVEHLSESDIFETEEEFWKWASSESLVCKYKGDLIVKLRDEDDNYDNYISDENGYLKPF